MHLQTLDDSGLVENPFSYTPSSATVLPISVVYKEKSRLQMSLLTFVYCFVAITNLWVVVVQLQPDEIAKTHQIIRSGLGSAVQYGGEYDIKSYSDFWTWAINTILTQFYSDFDADKMKYHYKNYLEVWSGIFLFQWKRISCASSTSSACYGSPGFKDLGDPFAAALNQIISNTNNEYIDYRWFPVNSSDYVNIFTDLETNQWINQNTSRVYITFLLYNPSIAVATVVISHVDFALSGLTKTSCQIFSFSNELSQRENGIGYIVTQGIAFLGVFGIILYEGARVIRRYRKLKKLTVGLTLLGISLIVCACVTISIIVLWLILLTDRRYSGYYISGEFQAFKVEDYLGIVQDFYSKYSFMLSYKILFSINIVLFTRRFISLLSYYTSFDSINTTLTVLFWPAATVALYILIFILGAAAVAMINFGTDTSYFSHYSTSVLTLVRFMALWDFDFEGIRATQVDKSFYLTFYLFYIFACVCIIFNMFIAIVYEAFDTTKMYRISIKRHGSQIIRTLKMMRYCLWPNAVLVMLKNPPKESVLTRKDLVQIKLDDLVIERILDIYGHTPTQEEEEEEEEEAEQKEKEKKEAGKVN